MAVEMWRARSECVIAARIKSKTPTWRGRDAMSGVAAWMAPLRTPCSQIKPSRPFRFLPALAAQRAEASQRAHGRRSRRGHVSNR
jgi:hypothetical protein